MIDKISHYEDQIRGVSYKPNDLHDCLDDDSIILLRANNISDGRINYDDVVYVDRKKVSPDQFLRHGDILICASSGSKNLVGKAAQFHDDIVCTFGAFCKVVRPRDNINSSYIGCFFQSGIYRRTISQLALGANINNIRNEHIDSFEVEIPDLNKQVFRSNVIQAITKIIEQRRKQLEMLDNLIKSRFVEMFGDPVANEKSWPTISLNDACNGIGDGLHGTPEYDDNGEYPFINGNNLIDGVIEITPATKMVNETTYKKHYIEITDNAILISINGTLGKMAFYRGEKVMLGKSACYCNLKPIINREFVYGVMKSDAFSKFLESNSTKSTIKNVGLKAMRGFRLIIPPVDLQLRFVEFVKQVDKSKLVIESEILVTQHLTHLIP